MNNKESKFKNNDINSDVDILQQKIQGLFQTKTKTKKKNITFYLSESTTQKIEDIAAKNNISKSSLIESIVEMIEDF